MATMVLRFPGGLYHATPSGHHVNEGVVEWPPSPWRLVRALIASGFCTQHWTAVPPAGRRLIESLCTVLPEYRLPAGALGHLRHYMPTAKLEKNREETTLVLDAFADVADGELWVRWPVSLDDDAQALFEQLVSHLGYIGRSESWVLAEVVADDSPMPPFGISFPASRQARVGNGFEQITLLAPEHPADYAHWRQQGVESAIADIGLDPEKKRTKVQQTKLDAIEFLYPKDLIESLQCDTAVWKAQRWSRAPGARSVVYWRRSDALQVGPPRTARPPIAHDVEMMLLALTTPSGSKSSLPTVTRTLPQAEILHRSLVAKLGFSGDHCPEIVGRDECGEILRGHRHSHILPLDMDGDGRLDHVVIFATMGLGPRAQEAIRRLRRTYMKGGVGELQVAVAGAGALDDLRRLNAAKLRFVEPLLGTECGSCDWVSQTPFVPPRHLKKNGRSSLCGQVQSELEVRGFPDARIEVLDREGDNLAFRHFVRRRSHGPQPPCDVGFAIRLHFNSPTRGPICLGYGSHFGLGLFRSV